MFGCKQVIQENQRGERERHRIFYALVQTILHLDLEPVKLGTRGRQLYGYIVAKV